MSLQYVRKTTAVDLATTELNSLAPGSMALGAIVNNAAANANLDAFTRGVYEFVLAAPATAFSAGVINVWFLRTIDGTNYESGGSGVRPNRLPDLNFFPLATTSAQRLIVEGDLPAGQFRALIMPVNTSVSFASSGNTLKVLAQTTADA